MGGKYLEEALNGLSLLWRRQNIVNEVKNWSKMADSSIIQVAISLKVKQMQKFCKRLLCIISRVSFKWDNKNFCRHFPLTFKHGNMQNILNANC